jgi:hypothetical protein
MADDTYYPFWWLWFHLSLGFTVNYFSIILSFETRWVFLQIRMFISWILTCECATRKNKRRRRRKKRWPKGVSCCLYILNRLQHTYKSSIIRPSTNEEYEGERVLKWVTRVIENDDDGDCSHRCWSTSTTLMTILSWLIKKKESSHG